MKYVHLLEMLSIASSTGMLVKRDIASNDIKSILLSRVTPLSCLTNWKLLSMWLTVFGMFLVIVSCK